MVGKDYAKLHKKSVPKYVFLRVMKLSCCYLLLLSVFFLMNSCDSPGGASRHRSKGDASSDENANAAALRPDIFYSAPATFDGCVGLYTYDSLNIAFDSLDVDKGKKIFATRTSDLAFFRLHRKDIVLHYDRSQSRKLDDKTFKEVFKGDEYMAVLVTRTVQEEGEAVWSTGTLEIIQLHGDKHFKIKIRGLSGC